MDKKKLKGYHDLLIERQTTLLGVVGRNETYGREADTEATQDPADKASNSYTKELLFSQSTNDRQMLTEIEGALERIADDEYGDCVNCSEPISQKRLEAIPWARHCIKCQDLLERGLALAAAAPSLRG